MRSNGNQSPKHKVSNNEQARQSKAEQKKETSMGQREKLL